VGLDRRQPDRDLLLESGSAVVEGVVAIAVVFLLFSVLAQAAIGLVAHRVAQSVVDAAARRIALDPGSVGSERGRLTQEVTELVPGVGSIEVEVETGSRFATALARFEFTPPGPMLHPIDMEVRSDVPIVVAP
jgi:hypothetical protein